MVECIKKMKMEKLDTNNRIKWIILLKQNRMAENYLRAY